MLLLSSCTNRISAIADCMLSEFFVNQLQLWVSVQKFPEISANSNENYRPFNFQALGNISENTNFPENLQP